MGGYWIESVRLKPFVLRLLVCWAAVLLPSTSMAVEQEMPVYWPWHGVSISFPGGQVSELARYKKELNINVVRFHVRVKKYSNVNNVSGSVALDESVKWLDEMLDECKRLGITSVINYGQFPIRSEGRENISSPEFWSNEENLNEIISTLAKITSHFSTRGSELSAYDIISEPILMIRGQPTIPKSWPNLLNRKLEVIHKNDSKRWLIIPWKSSGLHLDSSAFKPRDDAKIIWGAHIYKPQEFTHQGILERPLGKKYPGRLGLKYWDKKALGEFMQPLAEFQKKHTGPVFVGEFGAVRWAEGGEQYLQDMAALFDNHGWGWAYFSANGWHGWEPDYDNKFSGNTPQEIQKHYLGEKSLRWQTLRSIFKTQGSISE